ncbi:hypothetical protein GCM10027030_15830 [Luteococcus sediminum]
MATDMGYFKGMTVEEACMEEDMHRSYRRPRGGWLRPTLGCPTVCMDSLAHRRTQSPDAPPRTCMV